MKRKVYGSYVPCSHVAILAVFAEKHDINMRSILSQYNLSDKKVNTPNALMLADQYSKLLLTVDAAIQEQAKLKDFWFRFAQQLDFPAYGILGQALLSCENIQQAIEWLVKYYQVLSCGSELSCGIEGGYLSLNIHRPSKAGSRESIIRSEILVTTIVNGMRALLPDDGKFLKVEFDYKKPSYQAEYQDNFGRNCIFSAPQSRVLVAVQYLELPCPHANSVMLNILTQQLDQILDHLQGPKSVVTKVKTLIASIPGNYPAMNDVALQLGVSPRTLSRYLKDNDTTFQELVNQVKSQQASNYLQTTNISIEKVAALVGFSDSANFRRAFVAWTGMSPTHFRQNSAGVDVAK